MKCLDCPENIRSHLEDLHAKHEQERVSGDVSTYVGRLWERL